MQETSAVYKAEIEKQVRGQSYIRITAGVVDIDAAQDALPDASKGLYYSAADGLVYERVPEKTYATFEAGRIKCDGSQLVPSRSFPLEQGFVSEGGAGENGIYSPAPFVRFDFTKKHSMPALTLVFDPSCGDYPAEIEVAAFSGNDVIYKEKVCPNASRFILAKRITGFTRIDIVFTKARQAGRRARLQQVVFGTGMAFTNSEVKNAAVTYECDPICRRLPKGELRFTILNYSGAYDLDNPQGFWQDMEKRTPLFAEFGQKITSGMAWGDVAASKWADAELSTWANIAGGGMVESVPAGRFYLTSAPAAHKNEVTFTATDILGLMEKPYYKGSWNENSLYSLAENILLDAELPLMPDGTHPWALWEGLADIPAVNPAPVMSGRALLQLLAHAAMCVLYTDRRGIIRIEPMPVFQHDTTLDFNTMAEMPDIEKTPVLAGVRVFAPQYAKGEKETHMHSGQYYVGGTRNVHLEFSKPAGDVVIEVDNGDFIADIYACAADITLLADGNVTLNIRGVQVEESRLCAETAVTEPPEGATTEEIENPLIANPAHAQAVAEWVKDYLLLRGTYKLKYRGSPEIDTLDTIFLQSRFRGRFAAYVLRHSIHFNGALRGEITAKGIEEG